MGKWQTEHYLEWGGEWSYNNLLKQLLDSEGFRPIPHEVKSSMAATPSHSTCASNHSSFRLLQSLSHFPLSKQAFPNKPTCVFCLLKTEPLNKSYCWLALQRWSPLRLFPGNWSNKMLFIGLHRKRWVSWLNWLKADGPQNLQYSSSPVKSSFLEEHCSASVMYSHYSFYAIMFQDKRVWKFDWFS